eukprot:COSAG01_NODE_3535_length_5961_cov_70.329922_4_plen_197_part_00
MPCAGYLKTSLPVCHTTTQQHRQRTQPLRCSGHARTLVIRKTVPLNGMTATPLATFLASSRLFSLSCATAPEAGPRSAAAPDSGLRGGGGDGGGGGLSGFPSADMAQSPAAAWGRSAAAAAVQLLFRTMISRRCSWEPPQRPHELRGRATAPPGYGSNGTMLGPCVPLAAGGTRRSVRPHRRRASTGTYRGFRSIY